MGMIIPNVPADSSVATDFGSNIAVLSPAKEAPSGGPDAGLLSRGEFPFKELPPVTGNREARFQVVFRQSVLNDIHEHGKSSMEAEICGVLIGDIHADRMAPWAYIEHSIRGNNAVGKQTQVTITSETWTRIHETLEKEYPGKKIVGWYHTHPGFGIFLSGMDLFIQDNFFNQPWQVATVYDPHAEDEGTFVWRGGKSIRENALIENDTGATSAGSDVMAAIDKLNKRVKHLERRIDFILTGFLVLVLIALVSPLVLFALGPDAIKKVPLLRRVVAPVVAPKSSAAGAATGATGSDAKQSADVPAVPPRTTAPASTVPAEAPALAKPDRPDLNAPGDVHFQPVKKAATH